MKKEQPIMPISGQTCCDMSDDPRASRTRAALKEALLQLLERGSWGDITVAGIVRRAGVARSSFYEHFNTKADLLDEIFSDMMSDIRPSMAVDAPLATLDWLVSHVGNAPDFFSHAMAGRRGDALLPRFRAALIQRLEEELSMRGVPDAGAKAAYVIGGTMAYLAEVNGEAVRADLQENAARIFA